MSLDNGHDPFCFFLGQEAYLFAFSFRQFDFFRCECFDVPFRAVPQEAAKSDEVIALGKRAERIALVIFIPVKPKAPFSDKFSSDLMYFDIISKLYKSLKIQVVVLGGFLGTSAFDFHMLNKIDD